MFPHEILNTVFTRLESRIKERFNNASKLLSNYVAEIVYQSIPFCRTSHTVL